LFDYIVAGAGTAGCMLAARLTEDPSANVLLIEAGPPGRRRQIRTPAAFPQLLHSEWNWRNSTEPQEHLNGRRLAWPRGKVLGGSGSLGAMIHLRGCRADYDAWRDLGNPGWGFDDLAMLWNDPPAEDAAPAPNRLTEVFLEACSKCRVRRYTGFEGPGEEGAGLFPVARVNGRRWGATSEFLRPALKRGNLTVWTGVQACRVQIENGQAAGVEYLLRGHRQQVRASREVILCAGAVGSAQLLLLSGVGPPEQLDRLGIPVAAALPGVGENLQDHLAVALRWQSSQAVSLDGAGTRWNALRYRFRKQGPWTSNLIEAGTCWKSQKEAPACDLEILFAPLFSLERGLTRRADQSGFTLLGALLTPASRGRVTLASADPMDAPSIDPCYLAASGDRALLKRAAERAREIVDSAAFDAYRGAAGSDEIEELAVSLHHAAGTCRMGPGEDCVVDAALRVRGVAGLRVADAGIMPIIPRAHPNATVMAIAERAARLIRES
jgi:choline dehydrogenase